jgi:fructose-bisphosphate aldolase class I
VNNASMNELEQTARAIVAPGKGILAADESDSTIKKRFDSIGVESTEENRRAYRDLLFTTEGAAENISGVILFEETLHQRSADGTPFPELLARQGVIPGIKVDKGAKPLANAPGETITEGLDGLRERLNEYRDLGARFAKWRAVINIGPGLPSEYAVWTNAHALARYAALSQEAGLVPIVEPEVLMDGGHTIEQSFHVT